MAIRIIGVKPADLPADPLEAHLAMENFVWRDEQTQRTGTTTRDAMYDWIVNKKGKAYVKNLTSGDSIYVFGGIKDGVKYIRTAENGQWTDWLIDLEKQSSTPPGAS